MNEAYLTCFISITIVSIIYSLIITIKEHRSQKKIEALKIAIAVYEAMSQMYNETFKHLAKNVAASSPKEDEKDE